jgi:hypothetical protein
MGWGIDFKANIFLSKMSFSNESELLELIKEKEDDIITYQKQILMYVSSNPKDIVPDDWKDEPIQFLQSEIERLFEVYDTTLNLLKDLYYYKEYLKDE